jgi:hypothetical protein
MLPVILNRADEELNNVKDNSESNVHTDPFKKNNYIHY